VARLSVSAILGSNVGWGRYIRTTPRPPTLQHFFIPFHLSTGDYWCAFLLCLITPLAVNLSLFPGAQDGKMSQPPKKNPATLEEAAMYAG